MFKLIFNIILLFFSFIALIFTVFLDGIRLIIYLITGIGKKTEVTPSKKTSKHKQKTYEYDKENDIWHLSEEDKKIAKEERISYADYIEAEERDNDNLDDDD